MALLCFICLPRLPLQGVQCESGESHGRVKGGSQSTASEWGGAKAGAEWAETYGGGLPAHRWEDHAGDWQKGGDTGPRLARALGGELMVC